MTNPAGETNATTVTTEGAGRDFIRQIVDEDLRAGKDGGRVATRFPPEPNGYLHIGHAKSICLNFGVAAEAGGTCNLRFDDTNPAKEDVEYVDAIEADVRWLGFEWDGLYFASDYFGEMYQYAERLILAGDAYVDELTPEEIREHRGTLTEPGRPSPYRDRPAEESLDLFRRMRGGEFEDGRYVLRARIDMASPNINLRDPVLYRIKRVHHHRTGDAWCIYPMYDYAHPLSDAIEGITHSLCTLEFEDHRPFYDWTIEHCGTEARPRQIEFARLNVTYMLMSKRRLVALVSEGHVAGWDDPRMPTLAGMRRRGYPPEAIRDFCDRIGVAKRENLVDVRLLEHAVREHLNTHAPRYMGVQRPLKVILDNWPEGHVEEIEVLVNPEQPELGTRKVPIGREIYIEQEDFRLEPPPKYHRLYPGNEVRLRGTYFIRCTDVEMDWATNEVAALHCTYDPETRGGAAPDGRRVKGTIHWVSAAHAVPAELRLYDHLFTVEDPTVEREGLDWRSWINPASLEILTDARVEASLANVAPGTRVQFERVGYFSADPDSRPGAPVFNRIVGLKDSWAKIEKAQGGGA